MSFFKWINGINWAFWYWLEINYRNMAQIKFVSVNGIKIFDNDECKYCIKSILFLKKLRIGGFVSTYILIYILICHLYISLTIVQMIFWAFGKNLLTINFFLIHVFTLLNIAWGLLNSISNLLHFIFLCHIFNLFIGNFKLI